MSNLAILAPARVVSSSEDRRPVAPAAPVPEVGAAWGSSAKFDYSLQPSDVGAEISDGRDGSNTGSGEGSGSGSGSGDGDGAGFKVNYPPRDRVIRGAEEFREATLEAVPLGTDSVEVEGIRSVTFYTGTREIRHEEREVRGSYTSIEPTIEHQKTYLRIAFSFTAALDRGHPPPPDTPPLPDLDAHHGV